MRSLNRQAPSGVFTRAAIAAVAGFATALTIAYMRVHADPPLQAVSPDFATVQSLVNQSVLVKDLPLAEVAKEAGFPIYAPENVPANVESVGARIFPNSVIGSRASQLIGKPMTGFGLVTRFDVADNRIYTQALVGSVAASAGIPEHDVQILKVNGLMFSAAEEAKAQVDVWSHTRNHTVVPTDPSHPHLFWLLRQAPLQLTFDDRGETKTVTLTQKSTWLYQPNAPLPKIALDFMVGKDQITLLEQSGSQYSAPPNVFGSTKITVRDLSFQVTGTPSKPTIAAWQEMDTYFMILNKSVLTMDQIVQIATSMTLIRS